MKRWLTDPRPDSRGQSILFKALLLGVTVALGLTGAGCKRSPTGTAPQPSASAAAALEKPPANADVELWNELTTLTRTCKVDEQRGTITCTQGEQRKLIAAFTSGQRSKIKALPTFTAALSSHTPALQTVGANLLYSTMRSTLGPDVKAGDVPAKDATDLLNATLALPKALTRQALPAAVHASMLANQSDALYAALDKLQDSQLRAVAVRNYMVYGRLTAFKKIEELVKDDASHLSTAAVESPQTMPAWTAEEQAAICPWATGLLTDARPLIASKAASLLGNCSGEFIDKLLDAGERSLAANKFAVAELAGYRDLCSPNRRGRPSAASEQQCARSRKLLEKVTETKSVDQQARSMALSSLAYQWPDERTVQLAKRLEKSSETGLADGARRTLQRLEQRKLMASSAPSGVKSPLSPNALRPGLGANPAAALAPPPAAGADPASEPR